MILIDRGEARAPTRSSKRILPEFRRAEGAGGLRRSARSCAHRASKATVRHLATHTSGLTSTSSGTPDVPRYMEATGASSRSSRG